jgi:hypothetical protein
LFVLEELGTLFGLLFEWTGVSNQQQLEEFSRRSKGTERKDDFFDELWLYSTQARTTTVPFMFESVRKEQCSVAAIHTRCWQSQLLNNLGDCRCADELGRIVNQLYA